MKQSLARRAVVLMFLTMLTTTGCGLFGGTSRFVVPVETGASLDVASVELEAPGESKLVAVGVFEIGRYEPDDLAVLLESMRASAGPVSPGAHRVHVVLRRVLVSASNNTGLAVACVTWVLVGPEDRLIYEEQFYASRIVRLWGTMGGVKDDVHRGIAARILQTSARVMVSGEGAQVEPVRVENTYDRYEDAVATFPSELQSVHINFVGYGVGYYSMSTYQGGSGLSFARKEGSFDWPGWLERKGAGLR